MYKRCTDCEKRGKISEKKKNKQTSNSLIFIQVNSNSFIVIHHIKDFCYYDTDAPYPGHLQLITD